MKVFIGVDYNEGLLTIGFVSPQGILKGLTITSSPLLNEPDTFGQRLNGAVRGLRGEENLRMKDFQAIGIGIPSRYVNNETFNNIREQISPLLNIAVYIDNRDKLAEVGENWMRNVTNIIDPRRNIQNLDRSIIYGAVKLAMDNTSLGNYPYGQKHK